MGMNEIQNNHQSKPCHSDVCEHLSKLGYEKRVCVKLADVITSTKMARGIKQSPHKPNTAVIFPSAKMGVTVPLESFGVEYARALQLEFDPTVLYYVSQPLTLSVRIEDSLGRKRWQEINPDFLVISTDGAWFEETKPVAQFDKLVQRSPTLYQGDDMSGFRYLAGERNDLKLEYRCLTETSLSRIAISNYEFLLAGHQKRKADSGEAVCGSDAFRRIRAAFEVASAYTISELAEVANVAERDIQNAVGTGRLVILIDHDKLTEPHRCEVFLDSNVASVAIERRLESRDLRLVPGLKFSHQDDSHTVVGVKGSIIHAQSSDNRFIELDFFDLPAETKESLKNQSARKSCDLTEFSERQIDEGMARMHALRMYEGSGAIANNPSSKKPYSVRSLQRWIKQRNEGLDAGLTELEAVMPKRESQGKRSDKDDPNPLVPTEVAEVMDEFLRCHYRQAYAPSLTSTLALINSRLAEIEFERSGNTAESDGMMQVSYTTLLRRSKVLYSPSSNIRSREGYRRGNAARPSFGSTHGETPMTGEYSFHVVEIDHTLVDQTPIMIVDGARQPAKGKLMFTVVLDTYSRMPLAWYFTLDTQFGWMNKSDQTSETRKKRASAARLSIVLKRLVMRHGRLPTRLHIDGGSDFRSELLDKFLRSHGCVKSIRPVSDAKKGPLVERFFKAVNDRLWHQLPGSRRHHCPKRLRDIPKTHMGESHAMYTMEDLNIMLDDFMENEYPDFEHTGIRTTPRRKFEKGLSLQPEFIHIDQTEDELDFLLAIDDGMATFTENGVTKRNFEFGIPHDVPPERMMFLRRFFGKKVEVRQNPSDDSAVYVVLGGRFQRLISNRRKALQAMDSDQRRHATQSREIDDRQSRGRRYQQSKAPRGAIARAAEALHVEVEKGDERKTA